MLDHAYPVCLCVRVPGLTCSEDVNECERTPCFPGVQCFNSFGSFSCGRCPAGLLGTGSSCSGTENRCFSATPSLI